MISILRMTPGDEEVYTFTYKDSAGDPINVTGYTATATFIVAGVTVTLTQAAGVAVGGTDGKFTVTLSEAQTATLGDAYFGTMKLKVASPTVVTKTIVRAALVAF
jgi:hypothetical protein